MQNMLIEHLNKYQGIGTTAPLVDMKPLQSVIVPEWETTLVYEDRGRFDSSYGLLERAKLL